jgi:hypothetical protein
MKIVTLAPDVAQASRGRIGGPAFHQSLDDGPEPVGQVAART